MCPHERLFVSPVADLRARPLTFAIDAHALTHTHTHTHIGKPLSGPLQDVVRREARCSSVVRAFAHGSSDRSFMR